MTIITTSANGPDLAVGTRYTQKYLRAAQMRRLYDQLAVPVSAPQFDLESRKGMGTTYTFNFLSDMTPGSTAISQTSDIVPQGLVDASSTISTTSRGEALKWSELTDLEVYTDFVAKRAEILGTNQMETIEAQARAAALQGSLIFREESARSSLDAGTTGNRCTDAYFLKAASLARTLKCPYMASGPEMRGMAIGHSDAFFDLINGGNVISAALYQNSEILFNQEIGQLGGFKIIMSPWGKVFGGAGAANGSACDELLTTAATALGTTCGVSSGTNAGVGRFLTLGTEETANTHYDTNERVRWVSGTSSITFIGEADNGGCRFAHPTTDYVSNADSVYPIVFGSNQSLIKVFAQEVGEFGELVGPKKDGLADQWTSLAWKWYGGYGRPAENYILRAEFASSLDA